jgi:protease-4
MIPTIPRALDKIGVHTDGVGTTPLAGAFDITRPLDPRVATVIQAVIEKGYRDFTGRVAKARGRSVEEIDAVARGRVWSGAQARERGLVDAFGGIDDAVADAAKRAKLGKPDRYQVRYLDGGTTPFERFFSRFAESRAGAAMLRGSGLGDAMLARVLPRTAQDLRFLQDAMQPGRGSAPVKALAYCFCGP